MFPVYYFPNSAFLRPRRPANIPGNVLPFAIILSDFRERYLNRILREAFGQAKCMRSLNSLSA